MIKKISMIDLATDLFGERRRIEIINALAEGTKRFGELKASLGDITQKVLTSNLRLLEKKGIVIRKVYAQIPPRVEYRLTDLGERLRPIIEAFLKWGDEYKKMMLSVST